MSYIYFIRREDADIAKIDEKVAFAVVANSQASAINICADNAGAEGMAIWYEEAIVDIVGASSIYENSARIILWQNGDKR